MNTSKLPSDDEEELFYFESDHLALKGNADYSDILKAIFILEAQNTKAIKDYEKVVELHREALKDPAEFLRKLKAGESLGVPDLQIITDVPRVDWSKYEVALPEEGLKFINAQNNSTGTCYNRLKEEITLDHEVTTHKKTWTSDEQKRLEELLVIYPPEPVELRRFKKIATALGNRTVKQVSSRVQKYFLKLYREGLPIPGRVPKYAERCKKTKLHTHQRNNHFLFKPTTFFPQLDVPVVMNESEEVPGPSTNSVMSTNLGNYLMPDLSRPVEQPTPSEQNEVFISEHEVEVQLDILQRVKNDKQMASELQATFKHFGYSCDYCNETPIVGTRWHCNTCEMESVDFCSDCVISQMYSGKPHPTTHKLESCRNDDAMGQLSSDSSSESVSGSAFDSSNKNVESSNETSSNSNSEDEQFEETPSSMDGYDVSNVLLKFEEDEDEDEDEVETKFDIKGEGVFEDSFEQEGEVSEDNDYMEEMVDEQNNEEYKYHELSAKSEPCEGDIGDSSEDNLNIMEDEEQLDSESFTDTQNVSYSYLHSNLLLDNNTL